jgi:hypothetical protein
MKWSIRLLSGAGEDPVRPLFEHGALLGVSARKSIRLGPPPDYASASRHGDGDWIPDATAGRWVLFIFNCPSRRRVLHFRGAGWEPESGQGLLPGIGADEKELQLSRVRDFLVSYQRAIPGRDRILAKRLGGHAVAVLRLLSAVPESAQLAASNPILFELLAAKLDAPSARDIDTAAARSLVRGPQTDILAACGFPALESVRRLLARLPIGSLDSERLRALVDAFEQPHLRKVLRHLRNLHPALLRLLVQPESWPYLSAPLLAHLASLPPDAVVSEAGDLAHLIPQLAARHDPQSGPPRPLRSASEALRRLERLTPIDPDEPFPPAPFPERPELGIFALTTPRALQAEGRDMGNCAGCETHLAEVMARRAAFYSVRGREHVTVRVVKDQGPVGWVIDEIRTMYNGLPGLGTVRAVVEALGVPAQPVWYPEDPVWQDTRHAFEPRRFRTAA